MGKTERISAHEDVALFRDALRYTAAVSGFTTRLIEKDYFCTLLLDYFTTAEAAELVFKGGTCLTKIHSELYRLSEDLDYTIPVPSDARRSDRGKRVEPVRAAVNGLTRSLPVFRVIDGLKGANQSTQYLATVGYRSALNSQDETIKIEVSLREPLLMPALNGVAYTILRNPLTTETMVKPITVSCIAKAEALAEKFRAALSRRDPAIRDFYDIDHAARKDRLNPKDAELIKQVRQKLSVPGNEQIDISAERLAALRRQLDAQLRPVLRETDFTEFDLDRAFRIVAEMAQAVR
jgi:predicted nucleotidyltransferase component of viral defense system